MSVSRSDSESAVFDTLSADSDCLSPLVDAFVSMSLMGSVLLVVSESIVSIDSSLDGAGVFVSEGTDSGDVRSGSCCVTMVQRSIAAVTASVN